MRFKIENKGVFIYFFSFLCLDLDLDVCLDLQNITINIIFILTNRTNKS